MMRIRFLLCPMLLFGVAWIGLTDRGLSLAALLPSASAQTVTAAYNQEHTFVEAIVQTPVKPPRATRASAIPKAKAKRSQGQLAQPTPTAFTWPTWARTARIAGAYFHPSNSAAEIAATLDALAAQQVSVIIADNPLGEQYAAWVDDDQFAAVKTLLTKVVEQAHARGLKVVMYHNGLELISEPSRNPGAEHPEWAQRALNGAPILFNDVSNADEHWLAKGIWDIWMSPCQAATNSYRTLALARVRDMAATGIDGLWVDQTYLQSSVGAHDDLWPSSDPCSAAAFQAATGLALPKAENWDDPAWRSWIVWRHSQITDYLLAEKAVAQAVNPAIVFLNENSSADTGRSTYVATDPTALLPYADMATGHEIETIGDRMDEGETGMKTATLDQWLAFRSMVAFARGADWGKPSWILTYGYEPRDSAQLAGIVLAEGANFYETKGPQMADTAGSAYRTQLFRWIAAHATALYGGESLAQVGLLYSPRTRDLVDSVSGETYDAQDSVHFAAYRATTNLLYRAHIPFDVVIDTHTNAFSRYRVLIAPEVQAMSDATATALHAFTGTLITIGDSGIYDEWLNERSTNALAGLASLHYAQVAPQIAASAHTGLLMTDAPPTVQIGLRGQPDGYSLILVNTAPTATVAFTLTLQLTNTEPITAVHLSSLTGQEVEIPFSAHTSVLQLTVPPGIDTAALLTLTKGAPMTTTLPTTDLLPMTNTPLVAAPGQANGQAWLPLVRH
ncbi:MAG: hypothetical protein U0350_10005 [Caldilineaceae bacterium]